jgi:hypothetical protein
MWPNSPFARPTSSFNHPVALIAPLPLDAPLVQVSVNADYIPYIVGCLTQLLLQTTWNTDDLNLVDVMQQKIWTLIGLFGNAQPPYVPAIGSAGADSEDYMIRQDPDNPCLLQTSIDGENWCTFADLSLCMTAGQPGSHSYPQPAPGQPGQCYNVSWNAAGKAYVPTSVSSGDTINVSNASGAGSDTMTNLWWCVDGQLFILGACAPNPITYSTDPLPSVQHGKLILQIGTTAYDMTIGTDFVVPSGIINQPISVLANFNLSGASGSYAVSVCVKNNQVATWTHNFDFTASPFGFIAGSTGGTLSGLWAAGQGWSSVNDDTLGDGNFYNLLYLTRNFLSTNITEIKIVYDLTIGSEIFVGGNGLEVATDATNRISITQDHLVSGAGQTEDTGTFSQMCTQISIEIVASSSHTAFSGGTATLKSMAVSGTGIDPF